MPNQPPSKICSSSEWIAPSEKPRWLPQQIKVQDLSFESLTYSRFNLFDNIFFALKSFTLTVEAGSFKFLQFAFRISRQNNEVLIFR